MLGNTLALFNLGSRVWAPLIYIYIYIYIYSIIIIIVVAITIIIIYVFIYIYIYIYGSLGASSCFVLIAPAKLHAVFAGTCIPCLHPPKPHKK